MEEGRGNRGEERWEEEIGERGGEVTNGCQKILY